MDIRTPLLDLERNLCRVVLGQESVIRQLLIALLADGHLLLESLPGLAKTRTVKALAQHLHGRMSRIQFTPDLLPSDITGAETLHAHGGHAEIQFQPGPLFGNLILADEINRAPAKVQAALLEAMEERQITCAGRSYPLPELYLVLATQNPIEQEGTYPLPEAQLDRFLMKLKLDYPAPEHEETMLRLLRAEGCGGARAREAVEPLDAEILLAAREQVAAIEVAPSIDRYLVDLMRASRRPADYDAQLARWIEVGCSPRGAISLDRAGRAHAWLEGRDHVLPDDIHAVLLPVLRHRLLLSYEAVAEGIDTDAVLCRLRDHVAIPA
ncbi:AAA family ATPase [Pseudomonas nitroreducens]|uniref:AAA family ATPase n=1 Tax=Pseudomonas nitroreducens TaxID=46680 RepID=A0A5R8ZYL8_PSENT|nr:MoxR family ATPase [Pseudomonas nitroreducens]TLP71529.1 AAA family ATPase [Pseudomonas nitroreducens]